MVPLIYSSLITTLKSCIFIPMTNTTRSKKIKILRNTTTFMNTMNREQFLSVNYNFIDYLYQIVLSL